MIHNDSLGGRVTQFFASKALRGRVASIPAPDFLPQQTRVYQLSEPVIDTHSLVESLARREGIYAGTVAHLNPQTGSVQLVNGTQLQAQRIVLAAGAGNQAVLDASHLGSPAMQRRPLQMLVGSGANLPPLWAHIVGTGSKPLATITTHQGYWYVGGGIAEDGAGQSEEAFLASAPTHLQRLLPSIDLSQIQWQSVRVDRAEPATANKARPDNPFVAHQDRLSVAWPTKLALAPALADELLPNFTSGEQPKLDLPAPTIASTPWNPNA